MNQYCMFHGFWGSTLVKRLLPGTPFHETKWLLEGPIEQCIVLCLKCGSAGRLFSPFPSNQSLGRERLRLSCQGLGLYLQCEPHLLALNLVFWTFWSRIFCVVTQHQWTWQGFQLVFILLFLGIIFIIVCIFIIIVVTFMCYLYWFLLFLCPLAACITQSDSRRPLR
jgi:hypothetical protein